MRVYDDLKMKSLIKNKHQGHLIYPHLVKEPRLWKAYFLLLKLNGIAVFCLAYEASWFKKKSSPIVYYIQHTYLLGTGLIFFLQACYPFLEVKTSVSHIQSKIRHLNRLPLCSLKHYLTKADASQLPIWTTIKVVLIPS